MGAIGHRLHKAWASVKGIGQRLPARCAICHRWPGEPVCDLCIARFAQPRPRCLGCALPVQGGVLRCGSCLRQPPPLERCLAAVDYAWPWRALIAHLKFHDQPGWAEPLAWLMRGSAWADDTLHECERVLPMPLARERLAERGYNQSWLLARCLAPDKAEAGLVLRIRHTPPQRSLPRSERLANLQGAFAVNPRRAHEIRGRKLLLVDDVMTSGASLHSAARVLLEAGAASVSALVMARTAAGEDDTDAADGT